MEEVGEERKKPSLMVTNLLLIATISIQLYLYILGPSKALGLYETYSLVPVNLLGGINVDSIITYMFLHGNLVHLLVNSVALYGAGSIVERDIGHVKYLLAFVASGVAAGLVHCILNPSSEIPLVGSSGAIFGVIAVLFLLMPFKITFALVVPIPSVILGIMLSLVELSAFWMASDFGVAHDAHLAGFVTGGICAFIIDKKRAVKGLFIAAVVLALIYYLGVYFNLLPARG
ncbi:MAG: rhomboid family intramembrane serine protease [Candidatus Bathyarchaeota archaeon]|nr:rhomboid family intramembrane serine protease [Candidatus Bathyarchaeota archaeon]MDH5791177.1 rhomboid family intramembrane serine protease [Candidatus Bathyarchaeota archaeon]